MPDIIELIKKWWKLILFTVVLSTAAVAGVTYFKASQYLSVATAVPASSFAADKSKIFSDNIEALYSALGTPDDLDLVTGTAKLDTVYLSVTDRFNLYDHYKVKGTGEAARYKAALLLKKYTHVMKSGYGELKVKVWDTDKHLAAKLSNAVMDQLQLVHTRLQNSGNEVILQGLMKRKKNLEKQLDSATGSPEKNNQLKGQLEQYNKYIGEYQLMTDTKPPALIIVEHAKPSERPDRPRRLQLIIATAFLSFLFALLAAIVVSRKKHERVRHYPQ
jgi:uncharacterized protein involved in exopolysaccharide biosynthesis